LKTLHGVANKAFYSIGMVRKTPKFNNKPVQERVKKPLPIVPVNLHPKSSVTSSDLFQKTFSEIENLEKSERVVVAPESLIPRFHQGRIRQPTEAWAILRGIGVSQLKLNTLLEIIRGKSFHEASNQLKLSQKRSSIQVLKLLQSAYHNALCKGLDVQRLLVGEAWVGRMTPLRAIRYHSKGRAGRVTKPVSQVTIVLKELPEEEFVHRFGTLESPGVVGRKNQAWPPKLEGGFAKLYEKELRQAELYYVRQIRTARHQAVRDAAAPEVQRLEQIAKMRERRPDAEQWAIKNSTVDQKSNLGV